jgi:hypothetical protein
MEGRRKIGWKFIAILILAIVVLVGVFIVWKAVSGPPEDIVDRLSGNEESDVKTIPDGSYQAVFLDNGQVYFGRLQDRDGEFYRLTDVYYLEYRQNPQAGEAQAAPSDVSLVKLGGEAHGPEDFMDINREHILFIEDLKGDSKVAKAIADYQKK